MLLIHGDNQLASRQFYADLKSRSTDTVTFSGTLDLTAVIQSLESNTLFGSSRTVFIEKPFSQKTNFTKQFTGYISSNKPEHLVVWEDRALTPSVTKLFAPSQIHLFKISRALYSFLESLQPGRQTQMIPMLINTLAQDPIELVLYYLFSQLRQLIQIKDAALPSRVPGFIRSKLSRQAGFFTTSQLVKLHHELFLIDKANKTGHLHHSLEVAVENWLWSI